MPFECLKERSWPPRTRGARNLLGMSQPRILPSNRDILVVPAKANVGTIAVGDLDRLALGKGKRNGPSDARTGLLGLEIADAVDRGNTAPPVVAIQRRPEPCSAETFELRYVVAQVPLKAADRRFRLRQGNRDVVVRRIGGIKPNPSIAIQDPVAPTLRVTELGFERPAIDAPVDELGRVVLTRGSNDLQARAQKYLLLPLSEILRPAWRGRRTD